MRWAADKRLQFDVAVIKAVHLLDQVSLDEVLETLTALHDGTPPPARPEPAIRSAGVARTAEEPAASAPRLLLRPVTAPPSPAVAPPPKETAAESTIIDASVAWDRAASTYESSIKYRWLTKGVFARADASGSVLVQLPPSCAADFSSVVGEAGRRDAEAKLSAALGRKVKLTLEIGDHIPEPAGEEPAPEPEPIDAVEKAAPEEVAPSVQEADPALRLQK